MMSYYSFLHKTIKWWRKVFFWILEVATVNAYILYKVLAEKRGERPISQLAFRQRLILLLSEPIRSSVTPRARPGPRASDGIERLRPVPHFLQKGTKRRDCVVCSDREEGGTRHLSLYTCGTCRQAISVPCWLLSSLSHTTPVPTVTLRLVHFICYFSRYLVLCMHHTS